MKPDIDINKIKEALTSDWQRAKEIRDKIGLDIDPHEFGRILNSIADEDDGIQKKHLHHYYVYCLKPGAGNGSDKKTGTHTRRTTEVNVSTVNILASHNSKQELRNLIEELTGEGIDTQSICLMALRESKEKYNQEVEVVKKNTTIFYPQFEQMKKRMKDLQNEIEDKNDIIRQLETKNMVRSVSAERRVREGVLA